MNSHYLTPFTSHLSSLLVINCFMSEQSLQRPQSRISTKLDSARQRLRGIRHEFPVLPFRRPQPYDSDYFPSQGSTLDRSPVPKLSIPTSDPAHSSSDPAMDGSTDRLFARSQKVQNSSNVSSIFVHAGAGYHSTTNEHIHLGACNE